MWPNQPQWWHQSAPVDGGARNMRPLELPLKRLPPRVDLRPHMTPVEDQADMSTWWESSSASWERPCWILLIFFNLIVLPTPSPVPVNIFWNVERVDISIFPVCSFTITVKWSINAVLMWPTMVLRNRTLFLACVNSEFAKNIYGRTKRSSSIRSRRQTSMRLLVNGRSFHWNFLEI